MFKSSLLALNENTINEKKAVSMINGFCIKPSIWLNYPKLNNLDSNINMINCYNFDDLNPDKSLLNLIKSKG